MTARPIRRNAQTPDRNGKIFYTSTTSLSHISKNLGSETTYDPSCVGGWSRSFTLYCESGNVFEYHGNYCTDSNENSLTTNIVEELLTKCQIVI